jgi:protein ImuB
MPSRVVSVWFPYLLTDWLIRRQPDLAARPFAICDSERGRVFITATNEAAEKEGVVRGMDLADARALEPALQAINHEPDRALKLLEAMADWCVRYTPVVCVDAPGNGLFLDITGCAHLMGGETKLMKDLVLRFRAFGYQARAALADTPGAAWAVARYGRDKPIIPAAGTRAAIAAFSPATLRLDDEIVDTLLQLGLRTIGHLYPLPRANLTRRFGVTLCLQLDRALGDLPEILRPRQPAPDYSERLTSTEGILTAEGIAFALQKLLEKLCARLNADHKGLRAATLSAFRVDGYVERVSIGTGQPSRSVKHIFRLFGEKLGTIDPGLGLELFILAATRTEDMNPAQDALFESQGFDNAALPELVDRLAAKLGPGRIYRTLPRESHWPERAVKSTGSIAEEKTAPWTAKPRPIRILPRPEPVEVMAPVPDYPPMLFRHNGRLHRIARADGPERIEPEWWVARGIARDYYRLEDEDGQRYWIFRAGQYSAEKVSQWFLHGYFA